MAAKRKTKGKSRGRPSAKAKAAAKKKVKSTAKKAVKRAVKSTAEELDLRTKWHFGTIFPVFVLLCLFAAAFCYGAYLEKGEGSGETGAPAPVIQNFIEKDSDLSVHFIDVGQGDCSLIVYKDKAVLIDAGEKEYGEKAAGYISSLGIKKLDYVIATHPHSDHIGGMPEIIKNFEIDTFIAPKVSDELTPSTEAYKNFLLSLSGKGLRMNAAKAGTVYELSDEESESCDTFFEILAPVKDDYDNLNDWSVVIKLCHGENSFLFMGDAGKTPENDILRSGADVSADVLKAGHHGSSSSTSEAFLSEVDPSFVFIPCGDGNKYGHPHKETTDRFDRKGIKYYRADAYGTAVFYSDGETVRIVTEKEKK